MLQIFLHIKPAYSLHCNTMQMNKDWAELRKNALVAKEVLFSFSCSEASEYTIHQYEPISYPRISYLNDANHVNTKS